MNNATDELPLMEEEMIKIRVYGLPQPGGSKRAFKGKGMKFAVITDANPKSKDWKNTVAYAAVGIVKGNAIFPLSSPLEVWFKFFMPRNQGHFGTGKNERTLKATAPFVHVVKPDCTKLIRSTEDALTGIVWRDDAQIARQHGIKCFADENEPIGAEIIITVMEHPQK
jgi:Holliday junction resolvase RusA-like endonuclease